MNNPLRIAHIRSWWWTLLPAFCGLVLTSFLFVLARNEQTWINHNRWLWFPQWPVFSDLAVTLEHFRDADRGLDPLTDPSSHFGYPRAALALRHLHLQDFPSAWVGAVQALVWMLAVIYILRPRTMRRAVLTALLFISPPVWLGLERGNMDLMLFVLCVVAAVWWARSTTFTGLLWPVTALSGAALLKIYPVFALIGGIWAETGRRRLVWIGALAAVTGFWVFKLEEISLVLSKFPVAENASWGCLIGLKKILSLQPLTAGEGTMWAWAMGLGAYAMGFFAAGALGHGFAWKFENTRTERADWAYYWMGSAICCGSFVASNYAYRWVFALLTLPLLLRMTGATRLLVSIWARATLLTLALSLGVGWGRQVQVFITEQVANWAYILLLVFGCFALRPQHASSAPSEAEERQDEADSRSLEGLVAVEINKPFDGARMPDCSAAERRR
ncbi:MAG TPA: hypothetical protein VHO24_08230 [Opitutaceae bacterium]|nr:hypothetical protein [Opitutaceae bacterium]